MREVLVTALTDANFDLATGGMRTVTLSDGETIHNTFFDRGYCDRGYREAQR